VVASIKREILDPFDVEEDKWENFLY
jgi:hypothetical protein